jgi:hypothetical protein
MRRVVAPAPMLTVAAGNNEKARALFAGKHQGQRAVVSFEFNSTDASALTPAPVSTMTCRVTGHNHSLQADCLPVIAMRQAKGDCNGPSRFSGQR